MRRVRRQGDTHFVCSTLAARTCVRARWLSLCLHECHLFALHGFPFLFGQALPLVCLSFVSLTADLSPRRILLFSFHLVLFGPAASCFMRLSSCLGAGA